MARYAGYFLAPEEGFGRGKNRAYDAALANFKLFLVFIREGVN